MHVAKVILLLLLTLAVMRLASRSLGWLLGRFTGIKPLWIAIVSNTFSLLAFTGVLITQRIPGEVIDLSALTFGLVIFTMYTLIDVRWPNRGKNRAGADAKP